MAVPLVTERLFALGGMVALDGKVSWVPDEADGYQPVSCYLLVENDRALLVDCGLPLHEKQIEQQLRSVLPEGAELSIYLTRSEMDCVGNVEALTAAFEVDAVYTGGAYNPFDGFDQVIATTRGSHGERVVRILPGGSISLGGDRELKVLTPPFRMLTSFWAYDTATKTLFTSDLFGHHVLSSDSYEPIMVTSLDDSDLESIRRFTQAKYWWLPIVDRREFQKAFELICNSLEISRIAPTHGCILKGASVPKHLGLMKALLTERPQKVGVPNVD